MARHLSPCQKASPCGLSAWVSLCFLTAWWSQGGKTSYKFMVLMQGPANQVNPVPPSMTYPGRSHITSATVYWSLRFGLDSERGATEITSLWDIKEFAEMSFKLPLSMQKTFFCLYNRYSSKRHYFSLPLTSLQLSFFFLLSQSP